MFPRSTAELIKNTSDQPGTTVKDALDNMREVLVAARTYYVRTDGSDSNNGLTNSASGAFLTLQKAWDVILTLDLAGYAVTVTIGAGTFAAGVAATTPALGGAVTFNGAGATTIIQTTTAGCFTAQGDARFAISNLKMASTSGNLARALDGGVVTVGAGLTWGATSNAHMRADTGGSILATFGSAHTIDGGASFHIWALGGFVNNGGIADTLSGTPAFTAFASASFVGKVSSFGYSFSGAATGSRYSVSENSMINAFGGGASYFPGNSAGTTATGGIYA